MALREEIQKKIDKKRSEIEALETQVRDARVYIQALEDTLRMLPREAIGADTLASSSSSLRAGSKVDKARAAIRAAGKPLHVVDLLKILGLPNKPKERQALAGSLSSYQRKGEIFTRPMPNTFGLIGLEPRSTTVQNGPPPNFGKDNPSGRIDDDELPDDAEGGSPVNEDDLWLEEEITGSIAPTAKVASKN